MDRSELCLSTQEIASMREVVSLLKPFEEVTRELSSDKYVSISKIIPIARGLQHLTMDCVSTHPLKNELLMSMNRRYTNMEQNFAASTLLDPRFKKLAFGDQAACNQAVQRMTTELAAALQQSEQEQLITPSQIDVPAESPPNVWSIIDERVTASVMTRPPTSTSMSTLRSYFEQPNIMRKESPLAWWRRQVGVFPFLCNFAKKFLSIPGTSVPSERVFSKAGELISQRRSRIKSKHVDMLLFLNKNLI